MTTTDFQCRRALGYDKHGQPFYPIRGAESGYSTQGDIVSKTLDGQPLNDIWGEFQQTLAILNERRATLTSFLSFFTTRTADAVAQSIAGDEFERASEFGEPVSLRAPSKHLILGYPFYDYDLATRFTWKFLRDADVRQVEAVHANALASDNKLITTSILRRLLDPTAGMNDDGRTVYGLWNNDGTVPPSYLFNTFAGTHNHYMVSNAAEVVGSDIDDLYKNVEEHGYLDNPSAKAILFVSPLMMQKISRVRVDNADQPAYDFIPSLGAPPWIAQENIINPDGQAPADWQGLKIEGSYGPVWITTSGFMPNNYMLLVATGGPGSPLNPVGFREHITPGYQGLRLLPGARNYPLVDSFYSRGFGVGVRHRGAAAVMQIKASGTYDIPSLA
jgi:hypothetical protein